MAKVSVIIPVYNSEKYIHQAIYSVINQTLQDIEIICIDDCSSDNSFEIIEEYAKKDNRIKAIKQEKNSGQGNLRNIGIEIANSPYIMFLDSDDWLEKTACEKAYNQISTNKNQFVIFSYYRYIEKYSKIVIEKNRTRRFSGYFDKKHINPYDLKINFFQNCLSWAQIYEKDFLNKYNIRYSKHRMCEDVDFFVRVMLNASDISILNEPLYYYREHQSSTSFDCSKFQEIIEVRREAIETIKQSNHSKEFMPFYIENTIRSTLYFFRRFIGINKNIKKNFFNEIKRFFKELNNDYSEIIEQIPDKKTKKHFYRVLNLHYIFWKYVHFFENKKHKNEKEKYYIENNIESLLIEHTSKDNSIPLL